MKNVNAHKLVAATAREMAGAVYEELAKNDWWYKDNPSQDEFIERTHGSLLGQAREVLAGMLGPGSMIDDAGKKVIADALIKDAAFQRAANVVVPIGHRQ